MHTLYAKGRDVCAPAFCNADYDISIVSPGTCNDGHAQARLRCADRDEA